jgi:hypothetical protein
MAVWSLGFEDVSLLFTIIAYLVGGLEHFFYFSIVYGIILPIAH